MLNVLIPTDFSENASKAVSYALSLFGNEARYTILNSYEVPHSGATMLISIGDILEKDSVQLLESFRAELLEKRSDLDGKIDVKAVMGSPEVAVNKSVELGDYDVVVMGTQGASGLKEVLIGSVTSNVLSNVSIPVLAVPHDSDSKPPKTILFAADDNLLASGEMPKNLVALANRFDAEVVVLNIVPVGELSHVGNSADQQRSSGIFEGVKHRVEFIESDDIPKGIEKFITENEIDMLAMITRKNDLFSRLFGTSNTQKMVMHSHIPLFAFH